MRRAGETAARGRRTRRARPSLGIAAVAVLAALSVAGPARAQQEDDRMRALTDSVLGNLGVEPVRKKKPAADPAADPEMRALTDSVLGAITGAGGPAGPQPAPEAAAGGPNIGQLVARALAEGKSDAYIGTLLDEAAQAGRLVVPEAARDEQGNVDTDSLVALLRAAAKAQNAAGDVGIAPAALVTGDETPFPFVPDMKLTKRGGKYYYRVRPLDSLSLIALRAYGDAALFERIFEANRDRIENVNLIRAGQRLVIPDLRKTGG